MEENESKAKLRSTFAKSKLDMEENAIPELEEKYDD